MTWLFKQKEEAPITINEKHQKQQNLEKMKNLEKRYINRYMKRYIKRYIKRYKKTHIKGHINR